MIEFSRANVAGHAVSICASGSLALGFTEGAFPAPALRELFPSTPLLFLKQVHSDRIVNQAEWRAGIEADGIHLQRPGAVAIVQTADCLPLFFYRDDFSQAGVIHVGWRGLLQGIERRLAERLGRDIGRYEFFIGPAIEKRCYEVGEELPHLFAKNAHIQGIFEKSRPGKHWLDLRLGVRLSLGAAGVPAGRIQDSGLCTYCLPGRFPSYRRDGKTGRRIFNFLRLQGDAGPAG